VNPEHDLLGRRARERFQFYPEVGIGQARGEDLRLLYPEPGTPAANQSFDLLDREGEPLNQAFPTISIKLHHESAGRGRSRPSCLN
jgi:hypothetical protein